MIKRLRPNKERRGDQPTSRFPQQATKAEFQMGGVSLLGYSKDSPYKNNPYLDIHTPNGAITMKDTEMPLYGVDETGHSKVMYPGNDYQFPGKKVREVPFKRGGRFNVYQFLKESEESEDNEEQPKKIEQSKKVEQNTAPSTDEIHTQSEPEENDLAMQMALQESIASPYSRPKSMVGQYGEKIVSELSASLGYTPHFNSISRSQQEQQSLINQGFGVKNSWHLTGDAVDMKPEDWNHLSKEKQNYFRGNYDVINHNNHYHIEPQGKRFQMGGLSKSDIEKRLGLEQKLYNQKMQQSSFSQYTPQTGDQERMQNNKDNYRREENTPLNRAASSKVAANAMDNIVNPMIDVGMLMEGAGYAGKGLKAIGKYLTEETALKNAYKLNPYAFKANPEAYYRQIGNGADAFESGVIRSADQTMYPNPHFVEGKDFNKLKSTGSGAINKNNIIVEMPMVKDGEMTAWQTHSNSQYSPYQANLKEIPLSDVNLYKKDWLKGYKEMPKDNPYKDVYWNGKSYQNELLHSEEITRGHIDWADAVNKKINPNFNARGYENNTKSPYQAPIQGEGAPYINNSVQIDPFLKEPLRPSDFNYVNMGEKEIKGQGYAVDPEDIVDGSWRKDAGRTVGKWLKENKMKDKEGIDMLIKSLPKNKYGGYQKGGVYVGQSYEDIAQLKKLGYKFDYLD